MGRNYLKGRDGDRSNAVLAAAGYNFHLLLRWLAELFMRLIPTRRPQRPLAILRLIQSVTRILHGRLKGIIYDADGRAMSPSHTDARTGWSNAYHTECIPNKMMLVGQISSQDEIVETSPLDKVAFDQQTQRMASPARVEKAGLYPDSDPTAVAFDE